jgi:hypothetical protein
LTSDFLEIAKLIGGLSVAIMSMSVVTYALAVPRLQTALTVGMKRTREDKEKLEKQFKEQKLTVDQIGDQLKAIENQQAESKKVVDRLSWSKVVVIPSFLSGISFVLVGLVAGSPLGWSTDPVLLAGAALLLLGAFVHLLSSLKAIEQTAIRPEMSLEG